MNIFGWAADDAGPGFYRLRVPFAELAQHGHTAAVDTTMPASALEEADIIVGQRVCQHGATARWRRLAEGAYGRRPMLVFELDDDLWDIEPANRPAHAFFNLSNPQLLDNLTECARLADVCTVSTEPLAEVVRRINPNVVVLPNQLPAQAFRPAPETYEPRSGPVTIGWAGGPSHERDVGEMMSGLRRHYRHRPDDALIVLGTLFPEFKRVCQPGHLLYRPWTQDMNEHYARLMDLNIGLAPLRPSLFNRSKSEIKFLEYAAAGAAVIASRHGPYERVIEQGVTGLLVNSPHEWTSALNQLATDPGMRMDLALNGLAYARTRMIEQHWQGWEKVYSGAW